jgi:hypothetical protein
MTISASDVEATLRYVIPGFLALKVFYLVGLRTRRTDLEWTLWSLLAAAPVEAGVGLLNPTDPNTRLFAACAVAFGAGVIASLTWIAAGRVWPELRMWASPTAWDAILPEPHWIQVSTKGGEVIFGYAHIVASSVDTDHLDLYLNEPEWVVTPKEPREKRPNVVGLLIPETEIRAVEVMEHPDLKRRPLTWWDRLRGRQ